MLQPSTSSSSFSHDDHSALDEAQITTLPLQLPHSGQRVASASAPWMRATYPLQATTESDARSQSPDPDTEQENEQLSAHISDPDQHRVTTKTLRRVPRSRRLHETAPEHHEERAIFSPMPSPTPAGIDEASHPVEPRENKLDTATSRPYPWRRQAYPLESIEGDSTVQDPAQLPPDQDVSLANGTMWGQRDQSEGVNAIQLSTHGPNRLPVSPPSSGDELDNSNETLIQQPLEQAQAAKGAGQWHPRKYPLQMSASRVTLSHSVTTPPPSPGVAQERRNNLSPMQGSEVEQAPRRSETFRQTYPLQSPASVAKLKRRSGSQSSMTENNSASTNASLSSRPPESSHAPTRSHVFRTQVYPLQSPASVPALQLPPSTPQASDKGDRKDHTTGPIHLPKHIQAVKDVEEQQPTGRTIIVCLDGTGDKFDNDNSNIVHLISALKKDDQRQVSYYQAGIGTYSVGGLSNGISAAMDMAVGSGLGLHIRDAYHFLMHTYKEGDKICIFGFSRGAYTARCLAGMIHKVGLLPPRNIQQIPFAYEFYVNATKEGWNQSEKFKATFCIDVCVHFLGCFDSVASVGFIPRQLPLSSTPTNKVRYFRHAMALDERRAKFIVCRHQVRDRDDIEKPTSSTSATFDRKVPGAFPSLPNYGSQNDVPPRYTSHAKYGDKYHPNVTDEEYQELTDHEASVETDVLEVWFAGAHADVGGGAVPNKERHKLAQIPLRWMIRQAFECNTGIIFKTKKLAEFGLDVHTLWPEYRSLTAPDHGPPPSLLEKYKQVLPPRSIRSAKLVPIDKFEKGERFYHLKSHTDEDWTPEQVEDFYDAISTLNDQLVQVWSWWILEAWPVEYKVPVAPGKVSVRTGMNLGRYREVDDFEPNLHWTALHRARHLSYEIQARTAPHSKWRVVV